MSECASARWPLGTAHQEWGLAHSTPASELQLCTPSRPRSEACGQPQVRARMAVCGVKKQLFLFSIIIYINIHTLAGVVPFRCFAASGTIHLKRLKDAGLMAILARHWGMLASLGLEGASDKEELMAALREPSVPDAAAPSEEEEEEGGEAEEEEDANKKRQRR